VLPGVLTSAARARHWIVGELDNVPHEVAEAISVVVSELATNAIRHAGTEFSVRVDQTNDVVTVEVDDAGLDVPLPRTAGPADLTGRGLRIVSVLADRWGVRSDADCPGTVVWASFDLPDPEG